MTAKKEKFVVEHPVEDVTVEVAPVDDSVVKVRNGDSFESLAAVHVPAGVNVGRYVARLRELNGDVLGDTIRLR